MINFRIVEDDKTKRCISKEYNYFFDKDTGFFARWGEDVSIDPSMSVIGPEILDLEISSSVNQKDELLYDKNRLVKDGGCLGKCSFCYKNNGALPTYNMNLEEFKNIVNKVNKNNQLTQIALGLLNISTNPDMWDMIDYANSIGIKVNYTCHGYDVTDEVAQLTSEKCGAVAVSVYNKEASYNAIEKFTKYGMDQVNIHYMISEETYEKAFEVMDDIKNDDRLSKMNAIVFLSLKQKGGGVNFNRLSQDKYNKIVEYALNNNIDFGMDSCGCHKFLESVKNREDYNKLYEMSEPCESSCMSAFCSAEGKYYPCSFMDEILDGISIFECHDFISEVWNNLETEKFREKLLKNNRKCPYFKI